MWETGGFLVKKSSQTNSFSSESLSERMDASTNNMQYLLLWPLGSKCSAAESTIGLHVILALPYNSFTFQCSFNKEAPVIIKISSPRDFGTRILAHISDSLIAVAISVRISESLISVAFLLVLKGEL